MSTVTLIIIFGWTSAAAMFGYFALEESGNLRVLKEVIAEWLKTPAVGESIPAETFSSEADSAD